MKHFVANDAETDRFTVDNQVTARTLRELYLAPFEEIIATARPWAVMSAYNQVNGVTMTEHRDLQTGVLREEWGFDGVVVSDWLAAPDTVGAITGGLDIAMPGPLTVFGEALATAVRDGQVSEKDVDDAARRVLLLAARVGLLDGAEPTVPAHRYPPAVDGREVAREIAVRSFVLLRNEGAALPLVTSPTDGGIALIGNAAREARILGGGSATVFPDRVISPLDGLRAALPHDTTLTYAVGANPDEGLTLVGDDFVLRCVLRDVHGKVLAEQPMPGGRVRWMASALPGGTDYDSLAAVELVGTYTPQRSGAHHFGTQGMGAFRLTVDGTVIFDGVHRPEGADPLDALTGRPVARGTADLVAERPVEVSLLASAPKMSYGPLRGVTFGLAHRGPAGEEDQLIEEAVAAAAAAEVAVVVVATTEAVESEGFDRTTLRLPGRQDELVSRVAAANPRTVVVVNSGSPVEMPWRDDVSAILLSWFPGQEGGAALADVLLCTEEPGGRLPTTWPAGLADAPVTKVTPNEGVLAYDEGVFIGYRAWQRHTIAPAYPFGYGLGYTDWTYEHMTVADGSVRVRLRNTGSRPGREVVQVYAAPAEPDPGRASRWLVGFATVAAEAGDSTEAQITLPERAFQTWDETTSQWVTVPGRYHLHAARCATRAVLSAEVDITG